MNEQDTKIVHNPEKPESHEDSSEKMVAPHINDTPPEQLPEVNATQQERTEAERSTSAQQSAEARQQRPYQQRRSKPVRTDQRQRHPGYQQQNNEGRYESRDAQQQRPYHQEDQAGRSSHRYQDNQQRHREQGSYQQTPRALEELSLSELNTYARKLGVIGAALMSKEELLNKIRFLEANPETDIEIEGVLEKLPDGFGFLRSAAYDFVAGPDDVYVSPSQIRRFGLRTGDTVHGTIRKPKEGERYFALLKVNTVNGLDPAAVYDRPSFERLTPLHPHKRFTLEYDPSAIATRIMDMFAPIGKGQRGLLVAPPKVGKTLLLKEIAQSLIAGYPEAKLIVLLIDERPEEVSDMKRTVKGTGAQVISSTFDESAVRHTQVAEVVLELAKRQVECGKDVIILLDAITRLARAYNTNAPSSGKVLTGGIDAHALQWPKRFFGAARCTEEAGSLTIIATALVETGSRMDEVIYEEFKGTGNMEIHMTRKLSNRRTYPAFDLPLSGTRRDDLLLSEEELNKVWVMQKFLSTMSTVDGMEFLIDKMKKFKTNREFLDSINKKSGDKPA